MSRYRQLAPRWIPRQAFGSFFDDVEAMVDAGFTVASGQITSSVAELVFTPFVGTDDFLTCQLDISGLRCADDNTTTYLLLSTDGVSFPMSTDAYQQTDQYYDTVSAGTSTHVDSSTGPLPQIPGPPVGTGSECDQVSVAVSSRYIWAPQLNYGTNPLDVPGVDPSSKSYVGGGTLSAGGRTRAFKFVANGKFTAGSWRLTAWKTNRFAQGWPWPILK